MIEVHTIYWISWDVWAAVLLVGVVFILWAKRDAKRKLLHARIGMQEWYMARRRCNTIRYCLLILIIAWLIPAILTPFFDFYLTPTLACWFLLRRGCDIAGAYFLVRLILKQERLMNAEASVKAKDKED